MSCPGFRLGQSEPSNLGVVELSKFLWQERGDRRDVFLLAVISSEVLDGFRLDDNLLVQRAGDGRRRERGVLFDRR